MCIGAVYWSGIRKVVYASDRLDAEAAGFNDKFIYEEIMLILPREKSASSGFTIAMVKKFSEYGVNLKIRYLIKMGRGVKLLKDFYIRDVLIVAPELIGKYIVIRDKINGFRNSLSPKRKHIAV